jgi:hypothetical protein
MSDDQREMFEVVEGKREASMSRDVPSSFVVDRYGWRRLLDAEGVRRKEKALDGHEARHPNRLELCRRHLTDLFRERLARDPNATVNADDARAFCDAEGIERGPWMGSIFRGANWVSVGFVASADPVQHATMIRTWRRANS